MVTNIRKLLFPSLHEIVEQKIDLISSAKFFIVRTLLLLLDFIVKGKSVLGGILTGVHASDSVQTERSQWCLHSLLSSRFSHTDRDSSFNKTFIM